MKHIYRQCFLIVLYRIESPTKCMINCNMSVQTDGAKFSDVKPIYFTEHQYVNYFYVIAFDIWGFGKRS